jgi:hypothetical protein
MATIDLSTLDEKRTCSDVRLGGEAFDGLRRDTEVDAHTGNMSGDTTLATISGCSTKFTSVESRFVESLY